MKSSTARRSGRHHLPPRSRQFEVLRRGIGAGVAIALATVGLVTTPGAQTSSFVTVDLGTLGGGFSYPLDMSDSGGAVGYGNATEGGYRAFRWTQSDRMTELGIPGTSFAWAVNDNGVVVGQSNTGTDIHAFMWTEANGMTDLGTPGEGFSDSIAIGVNNSGMVIGLAREASIPRYLDTPIHGFAWTQADGMVDLGTLLGGDIDPIGVSESGVVAGTSYAPNYEAARPFAWTRTGGMIDILGTRGGGGVTSAVSDNGIVVGYTYHTNPSGLCDARPFVWTQESGIIDLDAPGTSTCAVASGVSSTGIVVGSSFDNEGNGHSFMWTHAGGIVDLGFGGAFGVSDDGLVVGNRQGDGSGGPGITGFAWTQAGGMVNLLPSGPPSGVGGLVSQVEGVTGNGIVFGLSYRADGSHATVWRTEDLTAPTASPTLVPTPSNAGWNANNVTVTWNWTDNGGGWGVDPAQCTTNSISSAVGPLTLTATCSDFAGNTGTASYTAHVDPLAPTIQLVSPANAASYVLNAAVAASYTCADQSGLSGLASCTGTIAPGGNIDTTSVGTKSFSVSASDIAGNSAALSVMYSIRYAYTGPFQPLESLPTMNQVKAGSSVPVKFSLGGDRSLNVLAAASPTSERIACDSGNSLGDTAQAVAGKLTYDAHRATYIYTWKTDKTWAGTCRQLNLGLLDNTVHLSNYSFK